MAEYIFLMHDDAIADEKVWESIPAQAAAAWILSGRQRHRRWRLHPEERRSPLR